MRGFGRGFVVNLEELAVLLEYASYDVHRWEMIGDDTGRQRIVVRYSNPGDPHLPNPINFLFPCLSDGNPLYPARLTASPLFVNRYGDAMTRFGIHALVEHYAELAAQKVPSLQRKRISPHTIRHTTATHLLRSGVDINTIRSWLEHVKLETTNIYAETDLLTKARALAKCGPGGCEPIRPKKWKDDPGLMREMRSHRSICH